MAGDAIHRRAFEDAVDMATFTGDGGMFAIQLERKFGMIHFCQSPAIGRVAGGAIRSKLTIVFIIFGVTGKARLCGGFQIVKVVRVDMAFTAGDWGMFTNQVKRNQIVVKG